MVDIIDEQIGGTIRKKAFTRSARSLQQTEKVSLAASCRLFGISRQAVYQQHARDQQHKKELEPIRALVLDIRRYLPRLGTRKLYFLLKPTLEEQAIKIGRDSLFDYLREEKLLIKPRRSYTKTTDSKHWMKKHPNLLQGLDIKRPEQCLSVISPTLKAMKACITYHSWQTHHHAK